MHQARITSRCGSVSRHYSYSGFAKVITVALVGLLCAIANPCLGEITDTDILNLAYEGTTASVEVPETPGIGGLLLRLTLSLVVVFGLILLAARLAKKYMPSKTVGLGGNTIEVLATRSVGARKNLMLVQVEGKKVLLGVTPQNLQFLSHVESDELGWGDAAQNAGLGPATDQQSSLDAAHA